MDFNWINGILTTIKDMSIRKIVVVFICVYPLFAICYFKDELKLLLINDTQINVEVSDINTLIQTTNNIKDKFNASSVLVFVYQPSGDIKKYKERIAYSSDSKKLFYEMVKVDLLSQSLLFNDLMSSGYVIITKDTKYKLSKLASVYNVVIYVIPIFNDYGLITSEVMIVFDSEISDDTLRNMINTIELIKISL